MKPCFYITVGLLMLACNSDIKTVSLRSTSDSSVTAILPLDEISENRVRLIGRELHLFYGMKVVTLPRKAMKENCRLTNTLRYSANGMLEWLKKQKPADCDRILGVSTRDIYTRKGSHPHWGIFGLGYRPGVACIVSDNRLMQFGKKTDEFLTLVTLHEIGHNLGLPHCSKHMSCLMNDAKGTAKTLFNEKKWLCSHCRSLLRKT